MPEIKLTLDGASAPQTPEIKTELVQVEEDKQAAARFSPEEEKMINEFAQKIDVTDPNLVFAYGRTSPSFPIARGPACAPRTWAKWARWSPTW